MANISFLLGVGFLVFFILSVVFIVLYIKVNSEKVSPKNCPTVKGGYGVTSNVNPLELKNVYQCNATPDGTSGTDICNFTADNLYAAEQICNKYPANSCSAFFFNSAEKFMTFVNADYGIKVATQVNTSYGDVYIRQV
jgi:hypothetical protein